MYTVYDVILAGTKGRCNAVKNAIFALDSFQSIPGITSEQIVEAMEDYLNKVVIELEKSLDKDEANAKLYKNIGQ